MSVALPFVFGFGFVASVYAARNVILDFANAKLFQTIDDSRAAAIYGATSSVITTAVAVSTYIMASQYLQRNRSDIDASTLGTAIATPLALATGVIGGRYLTNRVKTGQPLTYREIAVIEAVRFTELSVVSYYLF